MSLSSNNNRRIEKGFEKVLSSTKKKSYRAVSKGTKVGHDYALDIHKKAKHELHLKLGGDFGYGVEQDGVVKELEVVAGKVSVERTAERELAKHLAEGPQSGTLGVVSAGMESAEFDNGWEVAVLKSAFNHAKEKAIKEFEK